MDDLISRQTAIDALWAERMKLSEEMERNLETCSFALRADNKARRNRVEEDIEMIKQLPPAQPAELDTLIKALEQEHKKLLEMQKAQPEQRWTPVTERIPNKQTKVLVVDFGEVDTAYLNSEGRWMDYHGDKLKDVTAWMPLPDPYQQKGGEE